MNTFTNCQQPKIDVDEMVRLGEQFKKERVDFLNSAFAGIPIILDAECKYVEPNGYAMIVGREVYNALKKKGGTVQDGLDAIWKAGGSDWAKHDDPEAFLREIRGY